MGDWIQPVAVFPSKGAVKGTTIYRILIKLLIALEAVGCRVLSTVCDGAQTNVTLWNMCGIYGYTDGKSKKVFENKMNHPSQNETTVYFLRDAPHLMKCLKNYLAQFPAVQVCINSMFKLINESIIHSTIAKYNFNLNLLFLNKIM